MACTALTKGRGLDCNRISGGVKKIKLRKGVKSLP